MQTIPYAALEPHQKFSTVPSGPVFEVHHIGPRSGQLTYTDPRDTEYDTYVLGFAPGAMAVLR